MYEIGKAQRTKERGMPMPSHSAEERRTYQRAKDHFKVSYPSRQRDERGLFSSEWDEVSPHNFSAGGALFDYNSAVKVGSFLDLKINIPNHGKPVDCVGHVIRIEKNPDSAMCRVAVAFVEMDKEAREKADKIVKELLTSDNTISS